MNGNLLPSNIADVEMGCFNMCCVTIGLVDVAIHVGTPQSSSTLMDMGLTAAPLVVVLATTSGTVPRTH